MDKKRVKKGVIKRPSDEVIELEKKKVARNKQEEMKEKVENVPQVVETHTEVQAEQLETASLEQPVFVNMKGEPVQLGPNTVIVYEQSGNPSNLAFGGMWTVDSAGRIVMADTVYDVKGEPEEEGGFVQAATEVATVEEGATYQQYEQLGGAQTQDYEVAIVQAEGEQDEVLVTTETQLVALGQHAARWLNQKYDFVVRKLQLTYDAGVKLLHSPSGCMQCVYFTTPSMQMAFNSVPQFLCIETGIEFTTSIPSVGNSPRAQIKHTVTLFLAEDGNGKSVVVSAGISTLLDDMSWLLETFKSCNPAWRQVRCVVADPTECQQSLRTAFPAAHITCSVWQASRAAARAIEQVARRENMALCVDDLAAKCKAYALAALRSEHTPQALMVLRRGIVGSGAGTARLWDQLTRLGGAINKLDTWLEPENYVNILHKGLERLVSKFNSAATGPMQPYEFVSCFFNVANGLEEERRSFALNRLRDTENLKQSPTDTITQYAYNLMSHQTSLAQKCLDDRAGRRSSSAAICKYGTSTQECSCLFSKVFRLPCRHILMLTTELKVKTHIPFEPRWTVQHCLFGCENNQPSATSQASQGGNFVEQVIVEDNTHRQAIAQPQQLHQVGGVRQQQYVLAAPGQTAQPVSQVIFCNSGTSGAPVITSVLPAGGAVLTPHHTLH